MRPARGCVVSLLFLFVTASLLCLLTFLLAGNTEGVRGCDVWVITFVAGYILAAGLRWSSVELTRK